MNDICCVYILGTTLVPWSLRDVPLNDEPECLRQTGMGTNPLAHGSKERQGKWWSSPLETLVLRLREDSLSTPWNLGSTLASSRFKTTLSCWNPFVLCASVCLGLCVYVFVCVSVCVCVCVLLLSNWERERERQRERDRDHDRQKHRESEKEGERWYTGEHVGMWLYLDHYRGWKAPWTLCFYAISFVTNRWNAETVEPLDTPRGARGAPSRMPVCCLCHCLWQAGRRKRTGIQAGLSHRDQYACVSEIKEWSMAQKRGKCWASERARGWKEGSRAYLPSLSPKPKSGERSAKASPGWRQSWCVPEPLTVPQVWGATEEASLSEISHGKSKEGSTHPLGCE